MALGIWIALTGNWIGFPIAAFFGLGVPIALVELVPGSSYLQVDAAGFTICSLYRRSRVPWSDVEGFFVINPGLPGTKAGRMVGFNFVASRGQASLGRRTARIAGASGGALPGTYGKTPEDLAACMNQWLERAKASASEPLQRGAVASRG